MKYYFFVVDSKGKKVLVKKKGKGNLLPCTEWNKFVGKIIDSYSWLGPYEYFVDSDNKKLLNLEKGDRINVFFNYITEESQLKNMEGYTFIKIGKDKFLKFLLEELYGKISVIWYFFNNEIVEICYWTDPNFPDTLSRTIK